MPEKISIRPLSLFIKYLKYRIFSTSSRGYGIHSPFVYSFVRNVLVNKDCDERLDMLIAWHRRMKNIKLPGNTVSPGAGSLYFTGSRISASRIGVPAKYCRLLYRLVKYSSPGMIIEMGTGSGLSTAFLASANENAKMYTIEGNPSRSAFAQKILAPLDIQNCEFIRSDFDSFIKKISGRLKIPFLVFIDGNHRYESTMRYFNFFAERADDDSLLIFDDIRWSEEMEKAWKKICLDPRVVVSVDLFLMGVVFFKSSVSRQHHIINF